jgi:hypothetical protein
MARRRLLLLLRLEPVRTLLTIELLLVDRRGRPARRWWREAMSGIPTRRRSRETGRESKLLRKRERRRCIVATITAAVISVATTTASIATAIVPVAPTRIVVTASSTAISALSIVVSVVTVAWAIVVVPTAAAVATETSATTTAATASSTSYEGLILFSQSRFRGNESVKKLGFMGVFSL